MHQIQLIHRTHPQHPPVTDELTTLMEACFACAAACTACADACLAEHDVAKLQKCVRVNQDCAVVCEALARVISRGTLSDQQLFDGLVTACVAALDACARCCGTHGKTGITHCSVCAEVCRECLEACHALGGEVAA